MNLWATPQIIINCRLFVEENKYFEKRLEHMKRPQLCSSVSQCSYYTKYIYSNFWQAQNEFEVRRENEDTIREMLRIKRNDETMYNKQVNMKSAQMLNDTANSSKGQIRSDCIFRTAMLY